MENKNLNRKCKELKKRLSWLGKEYLENALQQCADSNDPQIQRHELNYGLLIPLQMRVAVLEETKNLFSDELERMGSTQKSYASRIEFLSAVDSEIEESCINLSFHLKKREYPEEEILAAMNTIKCLIHCTLAELQDNKFSIDQLRFDFINRLKLLLFSNGEGINEIISTLKEDALIIREFLNHGQ